MGGRSPLPATLFVFFSLLVVGILELTGISYAASTAVIRCHASERTALVEFKRRLLDPSHRLSSWVGEDCCAWEGVACSNITGHVIQLDLRNRHKHSSLYEDCAYAYMGPDDDSGCEWTLRGEISESLLSLQHLRHLDLSDNFFPRKPIPGFLGSLRSLTYLNLSGAGFTGRVPDQLGNLSRLHHLDLSNNIVYNGDDADGFTLSGGLYLKDAGWISRLTSLRHLKMNWVSFANASNWLEALNALPRIQVVELHDCELVHIPGSLPHVNFTTLTTLHLSDNYDINSTIPEWLFNITTLEHLHLGWTRFNWVGVPVSIAKLTSLRALDLSGNVFQNGTKTVEALSNLCKLQSLILNSVSLNDELINLQVVFSNSCLMFSLEELDLSYTHLHGSLPDWLGSMTNLKHLDLSGNSLYGSLPASLGSLSLLQYLDVTDDGLNGTIPEGMLGQMKGLVELHLGFNSLRMSEVHLANLSRLKFLDISQNTVVLNESFEDWIPPFQLSRLYMSSCKMLPKPQIPKWIRTQRALSDLYISSAGIQGNIPNWLPTNLKHLDLSWNSLYGSLPASLGSLSLLQYLDVTDNGLNGTIPEGMFGQMNGLIYLSLGGNSLSLSEVHLANLSSLKFLDISQNTVVLNESFEDWIPPFQLSSLYMYSCKMLPKPQIPKWIRTQRALSLLYIQSAGIQGNIPNWLPTSLRYLDLSNNQIAGHLPYYLTNIRELMLTNNSFSGQLSSTIDKIMPNLTTIYFSMNNLSGSISSSFCQLKFLVRFRISTNKLWGSKLPNCWKNSSYLEIIDFSNNNLQGKIPRSLCNLQKLHVLHLDNNDLFGQIPSCLKHCTKLLTLDLSHNHFVGNLPTWIGERLPQLQRLFLSSNVFTGSIPLQLSTLAYLRILDLANNNLSGIIPSIFGNYTALKDSTWPQVYYEDGDIWLLNKGREYEYGSVSLQFVKFIDLSNNRLIGHIPKELGDLHELQSLNLSKNYLTGEIPSNIKGLQKLEVLDLSENNLSGVIPLDLAILTFLNHLNLSYNNFSGEIPTGTQLQTFDSSSYVGNPYLYGFPLLKNCTNHTTKGDEEDQGEDFEHRIEIICLYASIALGFIVGFWAICGTLLLKKRWRFAYFRCIDNTYDKIYVMVAMKLANLKM